MLHFYISDRMFDVFFFGQDLQDRLGFLFLAVFRMKTAKRQSPSAKVNTLTDFFVN